MSRQKEQRLWDSFDRRAKGRLLMKRVENSANEAMPDVIGLSKNGATFWLELKALYEWPVRATTKPLARVFEPGQIPFMKEWRAWHGRAYVLLRVGHSEWYLLNPKPVYDDGAGALGKELVELTAQEVKQAAIAGGLDLIIEYLENL